MKHDSKSPALPAWFTGDSYDTVIVAFPDAYGRLMGKRMTFGMFVENTVRDGTHMCNYLLTVDIELTPLPGFQLASWERGYGDFHAAVDLNTLRPAPWFKRTAIVLCDLQDASGAPVPESPRAVLRKQLDRLAERGLEAYAGSELEFYLYHDTYRAAAAANYRGLTPTSDYLIDYDVTQPGQDEDVLARLRNEMDAARITIEGSKGEWGRGQHEVNLLYAEALETADRHAIYKSGAKAIAAQQGRALTFMAKIAADQAGNGFHLHTSVRDKKAQTNAFWDATAGRDSSFFRGFLGGLVTYGRELAYFFAPTINAYKRFQSASWAPTTLAWSHDNRTVGFRVVGHGPSFRVENRMAGADANPYLAEAATIAAGLRGVDEGLDCGPPYEGNAYVDKALSRLPTSLDEAADLLDKSAFAREALGSGVVDFYVHTARKECEAFHAAVTDWERVRYFERI